MSIAQQSENNLGSYVFRNGTGAFDATNIGDGFINVCAVNGTADCNPLSAASSGITLEDRPQLNPQNLPFSLVSNTDPSRNWQKYDPSSVPLANGNWLTAWLGLYTDPVPPVGLRLGPHFEIFPASGGNPLTGGIFDPLQVNDGSLESLSLRSAPSICAFSSGGFALGSAGLTGIFNSQSQLQRKIGQSFIPNSEDTAPVSLLACLGDNVAVATTLDSSVTVYNSSDGSLIGVASLPSFGDSATELVGLTALEEGGFFASLTSGGQLYGTTYAGYTYPSEVGPPYFPETSDPLLIVDGGCSSPQVTQSDPANGAWFAASCTDDSGNTVVVPFDSLGESTGSTLALGTPCASVGTLFDGNLLCLEPQANPYPYATFQVFDGRTGESRGHKQDVVGLSAPSGIFHALLTVLDPSISSNSAGEVHLSWVSGPQVGGPPGRTRQNIATQKLPTAWRKPIFVSSDGVLEGGVGDDELYADGNEEVLYTYGGRDNIFVGVAPGATLSIADFHSYQTIDLSTSFPLINFSNLTITNSEGTTSVSLPGSQQIVLSNAPSLDASNFIFASSGFPPATGAAGSGDPFSTGPTGTSIGSSSGSSGSATSSISASATASASSSLSGTGTGTSTGSSSSSASFFSSISATALAGGGTGLTPSASGTAGFFDGAGSTGGDQSASSSDWTSTMSSPSVIAGLSTALAFIFLLAIYCFRRHSNSQKKQAEETSAPSLGKV